MSKRSLMLSTAAVAVLTGVAFADTTIDGSKSEPYTTGALLSSNTGQANAGNITIKSGGAVSVGAAQGAITINTNNWLLNQATITNKDKDGSSGIHVDLSAARDFTGTSFTNAAGSTITNTGIYLDNGSTTAVSGNGTGKSGIFLDGAGCTSKPCTFTGAITLAAGSTLSVNGDQSAAVNIGADTVLKGDLTFAGTASATSPDTSQKATGMFGLFSAGTIQGNVIVASGGTLAAYGHGSQAMAIGGGGVSGYIQIGGALTSSAIAKQITSYTQQVNTSTNPEGGPAMTVGASVGGGIAILGPTAPSSTTLPGTVSSQGTGPAVNITPVSTLTTPLTIGVYTQDTANPGFSFYNRGTVQAVYNNYNTSTTAMRLSGTAALPVTLTGGLFNSGAMSSTVLTNGTTQATTGITATGLYIGDYVTLGEGTGKNPASSGLPSDQAALVISSAASTSGGSITASLTGSRGGMAQALVISTQANVPSLINAGTISALATTTDATLKGNVANTTNPLVAYALVDSSGTLTSIYNSGTISALAGYQASSNGAVSPLDNNSQSATAILLRGTASSNSANGVTIKNYSSATHAATITGDIIFGTGANQVLDLQGNGPSLISSVTGNVTFGNIVSGTTSNDRLRIGNFSVFTGEVTTNATIAGAGVQVDVAANGTLNLLNTSNSLNATTFNVANGGTVNLGVNKSLTAVGGVVAAQSVTFDSGSKLGVTYASFVPQTEHQFVLMTANAGQLQIGQATLDAFNNPTVVNGVSNKPYLLKNATLCATNLAGCPRPSTVPISQDALLIDIAPKSASELGLTAGSIAIAPVKTAGGAATTLFEQANIALAADNDLGSAFLNGIHNQAEAAKAYNNMAPNLTGGTRAIAISITDSATGPVGARQRALRMYGKTGGEMTLWGQEFVQMIKDPGQGPIDPNTGFKTKPGFRDHGFGFALGLDGGSPKYGWYGGALTFYAGDVNELSRNSHENQQWYLLSLYSAWRGTGLFVDTKLDAGYGNIDGKRSQILFASPTLVYTRTAENKHAGALISGSISTGGMLSYGAATLMPQLSLDGLYMREEGYTEKNKGTTTVGDGFDLKVNPYYAKSLRVFAGLDVRYDLELWDFFLQPEARAGYRYDFINDPVKLKMAFAYADTSSVNPGPGTEFTLTGPDPSRGNFVLGGSLAATTESWTLGFNFDLVRGSGGAFQQVGTVHLLGRI